MRDDPAARRRRKKRNERRGSAAPVNLRAEILREHSKRQVVKIALWVGNDRARFGKLMALLLHGERRVTQRASWIISHCAENHPELITPWLSAMVKKMQVPGVHDAVKRNVVRILQNAEIPRFLLGTVVSVCFEYLTSPTSPIAVKAYSMTVLLHATEMEADLKNELRASIEQTLPNLSPALRARGRIVLKELSKT